MTQPLVELDLEAYKLLEAQRDSLDQSHLDILKAALRERAPHRGGARETVSGNASGKRRAEPSQRQVGYFFVRVGERRTTCFSQKAAYKQIMIWLHEEHPELLDRLSHHRTPRGRRAVARAPDDLYARPGLEHLAEPIGEGWYIDTNLSRAQKLARLRIACAEAGLTLYRDVDPGFR